MAAVVVGVGKIGAEYRGDLIVIVIRSDHCGLWRRVGSSGYARVLYLSRARDCARACAILLLHYQRTRTNARPD